MTPMSDEELLAVLKDIRNWMRAASFASVKQLLVEALPDQKSRAAYQLLDGTASMDNVRIACKMRGSSLIALARRCTAMGLMEVSGDNKRSRRFDLGDFGLLDRNEQPEARE
jgi:hypothetical protein